MEGHSGEGLTVPFQISIPISPEARTREKGRGEDEAYRQRGLGEDGGDYEREEEQEEMEGGKGREMSLQTEET